MKDYRISGTEFPSDGETAKQHKLVVDMDKPSIFTLTKGSPSTVKTPRKKLAELWRERRLAIIIALLILFIIILLILLILVAFRVVGS
ncbi:unnamed protein product [Strongylus vulgaris]|uniref:Uncharacterized protein n=1 Tax=Strongylus vulgaris TaxID=40348 RepID=A0A3P7KVW1_STRVU|nr:unnamed protein product [Strongylus vulgaris]